MARLGQSNRERSYQPPSPALPGLIRSLPARSLAHPTVSSWSPPPAFPPPASHLRLPNSGFSTRSCQQPARSFALLACRPPRLDLDLLTSSASPPASPRLERPL
ncbi:hypothetical protein RJ55_01673 [Drechmeria coniospora]|nr:hypothetical protein RJ55_01673 [Drechmeria coniospora]